MDLLQFMYSGRVQANTPSTVLDVLMAADKYEVATCMRHCSRLLRNLPMTSESALLYLDLPSSILLAEAVQPLTDAARTYLATRYKDITRWGFILVLIICLLYVLRILSQLWQTIDFIDLYQILHFYVPRFFFCTYLWYLLSAACTSL